MELTEKEVRGPNSEMIAFWNGDTGQRWAERAIHQETMLRPFGTAAIARADLDSGHRVLDIGCGTGDMTVDIARRVGPDGAATGIDVSQAMLEAARARPDLEEVVNARFLLADAHLHDFEPGTQDRLYSRFGVMFFKEPEAAFANLHTALAGHGRFAFAAWRSVADNPWVRVPARGAFTVIPRPAPPGPEDPGQFSFADRDRVHRILKAAGFVDIEIDPHDEVMTIGDGRLDAAVDRFTEFGPVARAIRDHGDPSVVPAVRAAVAEALEPHLTPEGVKLDAGIWLITGRRG